MKRFIQGLAVVALVGVLIASGLSYNVMSCDGDENEYLCINNGSGVGAWNYGGAQSSADCSTSSTIMYASPTLPYTQGMPSNYYFESIESGEKNYSQCYQSTGAFKAPMGYCCYQ